MSKRHQHNKSAASCAPEEDLEIQTEANADEENSSAPTAEETKPDYYEQFVRLSADFENFRKRTEREKAAFLSYGKKELAEK